MTENSEIELGPILGTQAEWLLVQEDGKTFPLNREEIEITTAKNRTLIGFLNDSGFALSRLVDFAFENGEIALDIASGFGKHRQRLRLVSRVSSRELSEAVELARLERANKIAALCENALQAKPLRIALNKENGRLAQIILRTGSKKHIALVTDVSEILTAETLLASAIQWLRKLERRIKNPISEIWIAAEKRQARALQPLHALLRESWKNRISILEISMSKNSVVHISKLKLRDVCRRRTKPLKLPDNLQLSKTAQRITEISPENIDVIDSKSGETLRYRGLPFARVRKLPNGEKAWFGIDRGRQILSAATWSDLQRLIDDLHFYRTADTPATRHELYRLAPESWLESILRRNIKLLDANLILSPIYNQFRFFGLDKIDLLALRKDGRLVIIEIKTSPDREMVFQAVDYWRKIELQRRRGYLQRANLFDDAEIIERPTMIYLVAPALSFHRDFEFFARAIDQELELWRFELHENWREEIKVIARKNYSGRF